MNLFAGKEGKSFRRERRRLSSQLAILRFLLLCRKKDVVPKFIHVRSNQKSSRCQRIIHLARMKLLKTNILCLRRKIAATERKVYFLHLFLSKNLHPVIWNNLEISSHHQAQTAMQKKEKILRKKLRQLLADRQRVSNQPVFSHPNTAVVPTDGFPNQNSRSSMNSSTVLPVPATVHMDNRPVHDSFSMENYPNVPRVVKCSEENLTVCDFVDCTPSSYPNVPNVVKCSERILSVCDSVDYTHGSCQSNFPFPVTDQKHTASGILRLASRPKNPRVVNLSSNPIPPSHLKLLEKGLGFCPSPLRYPIENIICATENAISRKSKHIQNSVRSQIISVCKSTRHPSDNLNHDERSLLKELKENNDLMITKADKGGATVILDTTDYNSKVKNILNGPEYTPLSWDPTDKITKNLQDLLKTITIFDDSEKRKLIPSNPTAPRFYALPKIHKTDVPLRPIISYCGAPTYNLARRLTDIISPLVGQTPYHLKNSTDVLHSFPFSNFHQKDLLISFDVKNLFTSTPVSEAISCLETRLRTSTLYSETHINEIVLLTKFCANSTYFVSTVGLFKQSGGLPMGSPLSPPLCNLFMENFETLSLEKASLKPKLWKRYMDDIISVWPHGFSEAEHFLSLLNSTNPAISFTMEMENDGKLPFMDILFMKNEDGTISTDVYRKPCFTNSYFNANSCHHPSQSQSFLRSLLNRAFQVCSNSEFLETEISFIRELASANNFPLPIIDSTIRNCTNRFYATRVIKDTTTLIPAQSNREKQPTAFIPYHPDLSFKIANIFRRHDIRTLHLPPTKLANIFSSWKPKIPVSNKQGVYSIPCECGKLYIGQTKRKLCKRISEHKTNVKYLRTDTSAIANHVFQEDHKILWENSNIIAISKSHISRNVRESLEIYKHEDFILNNDKGPFRIDAWQDILKPLRSRTTRAINYNLSGPPPPKLVKADIELPTLTKNPLRRSKRFLNRRTSTCVQLAQPPATPNLL